MFKHLIALVLVALAAVFVSPAVAQQPPGANVGYAHLQDGALHRIDLWVAAADGLPFRSQWPQSAGGLCWCYGYNWPRCRNHGRRGHGVGRICTHRRSETRSACRDLCGCKWRHWSWRRRWCQPPVRRNRTLDRSAAAFCRGVGRDQPVSWSFKSHAFLGPMRILQKASLSLHRDPAATSTSCSVRSQ